MRQAEDGRWFNWFEIGTPSGYTVGLRIDVTDVKRHEMALEQARTEYQTLVDSLADVAYRLDVETGKFTFMSAAARDVFGVPPEQIVGRHFLEFIAPESRDEVTRTTTRAYDREDRGTFTRFSMIGAGGKPAHNLLSLGKTQIDGHGLLVAVLHVPPKRRSPMQLAPLAQGVARPGRLHLDHLGTELREEDQSRPGLYVACTGPQGWAGGTIYYSPDAGTTWIAAGHARRRATFGVATGVLASATTPEAFDDAHTVGVSLAYGGLPAHTDDNRIRHFEDGIAVLGAEVLGFGTATLTGPSAYTLSHLYRGMRGSPMSGHIANEAFVLVDDAIVDRDGALTGHRLDPPLRTHQSQGVQELVDVADLLRVDGQREAAVLAPCHIDVAQPAFRGIDFLVVPVLAHEVRVDQKAELRRTGAMAVHAIGEGLQRGNDRVVGHVELTAAPIGVDGNHR